ncbi:MAG TPA: DUF951 domain-containing protein [Bacillota bacterium]|nr:DUF951 domain-containing protein [Bacillota bacterium]HPF42301.1 DUF951 domain-containing protein [Bacillota bacterium]HPQ61894.1 DUF951 domain-containing protein [Bacillota bacterium]HRX92322.1 DUF951 domain-containing protein [Candidatus Izemoplasmatales bacterium]
MENDIKLGDIVTLKKGHPCGENRWEIIRFGADCKIKCLGCGRIVLIDRPTLKKRIKKVLGNINEGTAEENNQISR